MAVIPLILVIVFNFFLSFYLLNRYGNLGKHNILVTISVFVAWYFSFNVIFILPLDVTSTIYRQCVFEANHTDPITTTTTTQSTLLPFNNESNLIPTTTLPPIPANNGTIDDKCRMPWSYIPNDVLLNLWQFIYWSSQMLTWLFLPIFQSYSMSGEFSTLRKLRSSLIDNLKYYFFFGVLFILFLIYYASKETITFEGLKIFCISASNTFGLFLLIILLGYGLVQIPRSCFARHRQHSAHRLNYLYFKVAKLNGEKCDGLMNLEGLVNEIEQLNAYALARRDDPKMRNEYIPKIEQCLNRIREQTNQNLVRGEVFDCDDQSLGTKLTESNLVRLNAKLKKAIQNSHRTDVQYSLLIQEAIDFKYYIENPNDIQFSAFEQWLCNNVPVAKSILINKYTIKKCCFFILGYILATFSAIIIWSEITFVIKSYPISLFALLVTLLGNNYLWIEIFSMLAIAYLCICCYYTVFKIRIFNYYYLASHHQTDEYSLIFCGMLLCRLASPMCLNFLSMIHFDSHIASNKAITQETTFTQIMGHMDTVSFISDHLFIYLPVLMSLFCIATLFNLESKIISCFDIDQFILSDENTQDMIKLGTVIIRRELQKREPKTSNVSSQQRNAMLERHKLKRATSHDQLLVSCSQDKSETTTTDGSPSTSNVPPIISSTAANRNFNNRSLFDDI